MVATQEDKDSSYSMVKILAADFKWGMENLEGGEERPPWSDSCF